MKNTLKRILASTLALAMLLSFTVVGYAADTARVYIYGSDEVTAGETAAFTVAIENNTGVAGFTLQLKIYDANGADASEYFTYSGNWLTATGILKDDENETIGSLSRSSDDYVINWNTTDNVSGDGDLVTMKLDVASEAYDGEYTMVLTLDGNLAGNFANASLDAVDVQFDEYTFTVTGGKEVTAEAPSITTSPTAAEYTYGDTAAEALSVSATVSEGTLSYQWYSNTSDSTTGGTAITGATDATYTPDISAVGTTYYYCVVTNTINGVTASATSNTAAVTVNAQNIAGIAEVGLLDGPYTYTGEAIEPCVVVLLGETQLTEGTDYTVSYSNNINVGTEDTTPAVIVSFIGNYTGKITCAFTIDAADQILSVTKEISARYSTTLDLSSLVSGNQGELTFTLPEDANGYSLSGSNLIVSSTIGAAVDVTVTAAATTNYNASSEYTITVTSIDKTDVSGAITFDNGSTTYTGAEQSIAEATIESGYTGRFSYSYALDGQTLTGLPVDAGEYTVTATYEDDENMGSKSAIFTINPKAISADDFTIAATAEYTGEAITPAVASTTLSESDYTVEYSNNTAVGTATVTVTGQGNCGGTVTLTFEITAADISESAVVTVAEGTYTYSSEAITPEVTVTLNDEALTAGTDYSVAYTNNIDAGEATVTVTFTGNYTGTATATFTINGADRGDPTITASPVALNDDYCVTLSGSSLTTTLTVTPAENDGAEITYSSSDTSVVSVNSNGVITALANGDAEITVTVAAKGSYNALEMIVGVTSITDPITAVSAASDGDTDSVTVSLDGTTITVAGLVSESSTVTLTYSTYTSDGEGTDTAAITYNSESGTFNVPEIVVEGVTYAVDVSSLIATDITVNHIDTVADVSEDIAENDVEAVKAAAESVDGDLTAHVSELLKDIINSLDEDTAAADITVGVYFKVTATGYTYGESMKLAVEPMYVVTKAGVDEPIDSGTISNDKLTGTISFTIALPADFPTDNLYAIHSDDDGNVKEWIEVPVYTDGDNNIATVSTTSFSTFELVQNDDTVTVNYNFYDGSTKSVAYTASDIGTALESDTRSGYTFAGWATTADATSAAYSGTLTEAMLTELAAIEGAVDLYPVFTKNSSGGGSGGSSSSSSSYSVSSSTSVTGGTVSFSSASAAAGRTVTVTVTADEGYLLSSLTVTDADGNTISVTDKGNGTYTFTMPSSAVTVTPVFAEENCASEQFSDVDTSKWYHDAIDYVVTNGYFSGTSATTFEPDISMTRAMFVQVLANIAGIDASEYAGSSFTDVAADAWYAAAVEWAYQNGIVLGVTDDTFAPETTISREQMIVMLYRYAEYLGEDVSVADESAINAFADSASVSDWAVTAMAWAVESNVINGTDTGIEPLRNATRAEAAQMFINFDNRA